MIFRPSGNASIGQLHQAFLDDYKRVYPFSPLTSWGSVVKSEYVPASVVCDLTIRCRGGELVPQSKIVRICVCLLTAAVARLKSCFLTDQTSSSTSRRF